MIRDAIIKLATEHPEFRKYLVPLLRESFSGRIAREFSNKKQLDEYMKEHPGGDRRKHTIRGPKSKGTKNEAPDLGVGEVLTKEEAQRRVEKMNLPEEVKQRLDDYHLGVIGDDLDQAAEIAKKIIDGIGKSADVCKMSPPVCKGNMGLTRDKMPQIPGDMSVKEMLVAVKKKKVDKRDPNSPEKGVDCNGKFVDDDKDACPDEETRAKGKAAVEAGADPKDDRSVLKSMLDTFSDRGVKIQPKKISVGRLKATQSEIKAGKTFGMADAHLKGEFPNIGDQIVVSKDGHILDGHHRWAALLTIDPKRKMSCIQVDMTMKDMLDEADGMPGVYREDFQGKPIPMSDEIKKKKKDKAKGDKK